MQMTTVVDGAANVDDVLGTVAHDALHGVGDVRRWRWTISVIGSTRGGVDGGGVGWQQCRRRQQMQAGGGQCASCDDDDVGDSSGSGQHDGRPGSFDLGTCRGDRQTAARSSGACEGRVSSEMGRKRLCIGHREVGLTRPA
ncbi:hypothetical protein ACLOJK_006510 [Asimina triloba]